MNWSAAGVVVMALLLSASVTDAARNQHPYLTAKWNYENVVSAYVNSGVGLQQVRPREDQSQAITVSVGMNLYGVLDFNAVDGIINMIGSMTFEWTDEIVNINSVNLTVQKDSIFFEVNQIWTPNLVLMNDAVNIHRIGDTSYKVRFNLTSGVCQWKPRMIINAACTADMLYYPFDKQVCTLSVTPWFRESDKVVLAVLTDAWDIDDFMENGIWALESTSSRAYVNNGSYYADFEITIKRKPMYLAIVIVLPILLLSLLTGFLFLLPPDSGSRVGFGITCFLSFVVILQTLMQFLPETSVPMSLLCVYIIVMLMFSAGLSIFNVFILRLYLTPDKAEVPNFFVQFLDLITFRKVKRTFRRCRRRARRFNYDMSKRWSNYKENNKHKQKQRSVVGYHEQTNRADCNAKTKYRTHRPTFYKPYEAPQVAETTFDETIETENDGLVFRARNRNMATSDDVYKSNVTEIVVHQELKKGDEAAVVKVGPGEYRSNAQYLDTIGKVVEEDAPFIDDVEAEDVKLVVNLTWEKVAMLLDYFFIVAFIGVQIAFSVMFLVPIYSQY